jgi:hypothetical protein
MSNQSPFIDSAGMRCGSDKPIELNGVSPSLERG